VIDVTMTFRVSRPDGTADTVTVQRRIDRPGDPAGTVVPGRLHADIAAMGVRLAHDVNRIYAPRET
jgi:hypothetical protein